MILGVIFLYELRVADLFCDFLLFWVMYVGYCCWVLCLVVGVGLYGSVGVWVGVCVSVCVCVCVCACVCVCVCVCVFLCVCVCACVT